MNKPGPVQFNLSVLLVLTAGVAVSLGILRIAADGPWNVYVGLVALVVTGLFCLNRVQVSGRKTTAVVRNLHGVLSIVLGCLGGPLSLITLAAVGWYLKSGKRFTSGELYGVVLGFLAVAFLVSSVISLVYGAAATTICEQIVVTALFSLIPLGVGCVIGEAYNRSGDRSGKDALYVHPESVTETSSGRRLGVQFELKYLFVLVTGLAVALGLAKANDFNGWGIYFGIMISTYVLLHFLYKVQVVGTWGYPIYRIVRGMLWVVATCLFGPLALILLVVLGAWLRDKEHYTSREFAWMFVAIETLLLGTVAIAGFVRGRPGDLASAIEEVVILSIFVLGPIMTGFTLNALGTGFFSGRIIPPVPDDLLLPNERKKPDELAEKFPS